MKKKLTPEIGGKADPLLARPDAERELFRQFSALANGFPREAVRGAAANVLINTFRQDHGSRAKAEAAFDETVTRLKFLLLEGHYDNVGKRRNIFPHTQTIEVPFLDR